MDTSSDSAMGSIKNLSPRDDRCSDSDIEEDKAHKPAVEDITDSEK